MHSSASINSYRNSSKILTHKSFDCINDNQDDDLHKYSETDSLLPKNEINPIIVGSTTQRYICNGTRSMNKIKYFNIFHILEFKDLKCNFNSNHNRIPSKMDGVSASPQPASILSKGRQNTGITNPLEEHRNQSNRQANKFNSDRATKNTTRSRTISES